MAERVGVWERAVPALVTVALAFCAKLASAPGQSFFLAVFVDDILADTGISRAGFSSVYALATVCSAAMVVGVGRLIDRFGPARVWVFVAGGLSVACLSLSVAGDIVMVLISLCLARGFGQGSFPMLGTFLVAARFGAARGRAVAIAAQGLTLAGLVLPVAMAAVIAAIGWRGALQATALVLLVGILPLAVLVGRQGAVPHVLVERASLRDALRLPGCGRLLLILAVPPLISTSLVIHALGLLGASGLERSEAALVISGMALFIALGALAGGLLADRLGSRRVLVLCGIALVAGSAPLLASHPAPALAGYALVAVAQGLCSTANGTVWAATYGTAALGRLQGLGSSAQIAGAAVGPLVLAAPVALGAGFGAGVAVLLALSCAALALAWRWRPQTAEVGGGAESRQPQAVQRRPMR